MWRCIEIIGIEILIQFSGLTQTDFATRELHTTKQNLSLWITGKRKIPKKHKQFLSRKYDLPEDFFETKISDYTANEFYAQAIGLLRKAYKMNDL